MLDGMVGQKMLRMSNFLIFAWLCRIDEHLKIQVGQPILIASWGCKIDYWQYCRCCYVRRVMTRCYVTPHFLPPPLNTTYELVLHIVQYNSLSLKKCVYNKNSYSQLSKWNDHWDCVAITSNNLQRHDVHASILPVTCPIPLL